MTKKIIYITMAALLGAGIGAFLSYGPFQRFKSEAVLNIDIDLVSYKRLTHLLNDPARFRQYTAQIKPQNLIEEEINNIIKDIENVDWYKPLPRYTKWEVKDLPDSILRLEQEGIKLSDQNLAVEIDNLIDNKTNLIRTEYTAYIGIFITSQANDPERALNKVNWLSNYAFDAAAYSAIELLITKWSRDNKLIAANYQTIKIQHESAAEQLKVKIATLKKAVSKYPQITYVDVESFALAMKNKSQTMTPRAHLIAAEFELLELESTIQVLNRSIEQTKIAEQVTRQLSVAEHTQLSGNERINELDDLLITMLAKTEQLSLREKLLSMRMEVSSIKARVSKNPAYIMRASAPEQIGSSPLKIIVLCSVFLAFLMSIFIWRKFLMKHLIQDANTLSIQK